MTTSSAPWRPRAAALATLLAAALLALSAPPAAAQTLRLDDKKGLLLLDDQGREQDRLTLRAKRWDQRRGADGAPQAVVLDADRGRLHWLAARGGRLQPLATLDGPDFAVERLCLYRDADQGLLQLFLLGEDGLSEQWLLHQGRAHVLRRLATPLHPAACQARDADAELLVAEPGVGLWAYAADAEQTRRRLLQALPAQGDGKAQEQAAAQALAQWQAAHPEAAARPGPVPVLRPSAQTEPVRGQGDAADDPAIWVHPRRPADSLILATDKKRGLAVYDLRGRERQFLPVGRVNNVDLRQGLRYGGQRWDLAVATQRDEASLLLWAISPQGRLRELARLPSGLDDLYGVCVGRAAGGELDIYANDKDGRLRRLRVERGADGRWQGRLLREWKLASQPEGCVVDEAGAQLFVGEEKRGVWRIALDDAATGGEPQLAIPLSDALHADVEGLAIHAASPTERLLVVSSQGSDSYAVYDAQAPHALRGRFRIGIHAELGIDGVSETDGLDVVAADLGGAYREGVLVVQDGHKRLPQGRQNFKLVPWAAVKGVLGAR
ncbi:phytase [Pelomonas sp. CA6]|uniref:phytase n=1 Tax=Pelomonas sp. CA6 TaxID=2907999 RepID=UPI001F4BCAE2|nr:phytase [Pelomonas sp. CA6]MCH7342528.1 phytase [Pelomonas sp. CA6]